MNIRCRLSQGSGMAPPQQLTGLGDTGSDCNFVSEEWAKQHGFIPLTTCDVEFVTFSGDKFKTTNAYDFICTITDDRGETRTHKLRFYGCQNVGHKLVFGMEFYESTIAQYCDYRKKRWAYALSWPQDIDILTPEEFVQELESNPQETAQALFVSKGECNCGGSCICYPANKSSGKSHPVFYISAADAKVPEYLSDFADVFDEAKAGELPDLGGVEHSIDTTDPPPYGPLYNLSETQLEALRDYLANAIKKRWIRPSVSPAGAPILFVPKKDGGLRLCVDYRGLNKVTVKNRHPLPLIDETLDRLVGAKVFTKLDLKDAYHRIRIREGHEWKTAFRTRYGHFEYLVMPFGLANAPATFQAYINTAMAGMLDRSVVVYLDDILIYSQDPEQHHEHVREVLAALRKHKLFAKLSKCSFDVQELEFLGFVVGTNGVSPDPERVRTIVEWPVPESFHDVQVFLGFANFYRRFVHRYSHIARGLTNLLIGMEKGRKSGPFEWTVEAQDSFDELKRAFTQAPILTHFDPVKKIRVETDASKFAVAGRMSQQSEDPLGAKKHWHPVAFWSRKLTGAERNYSTHDGELLAIVGAFKQWRHYLEGARHTIEVVTDHNNLRYFMETKYLESRQARWAMYLAAYDFQIMYRKGSANPADGPSRRPDYVEGPTDNTWLPTFQNKLKGAFAVQFRRLFGLEYDFSRGENLHAAMVARGSAVQVRGSNDPENGHTVGVRESHDSEEHMVEVQGSDDSEYRTVQFRGSSGPENVSSEVSSSFPRGRESLYPQTPSTQDSMLFAQGTGGGLSLDHGSGQEGRSFTGSVSTAGRRMSLSCGQTDHSRRKQGKEQCLVGFGLTPMMDELSMVTPSDEACNLTSHQVMELDGCKHLTPRSWICAATEKSSALAPLSHTLTEVIRVAQMVDDFAKSVNVRDMSKRDREGERLWTVDETGLLRRSSRIYIPKDPAILAEVMKLHHDDPLAGHYGVNKTLELLRRSYWWDGMEEDVRSYCRECDICQRVKVKRHRPYGLLSSLPQPTRPWGEISMDFITGLPLSQNPEGGPDFDAILVVVDRYTKMARYVACHKTVDSPELAKILWDRVFSIFGTPGGIVSDRGTVFTSEFWSAFCFHLHCKRRLSTAFHPQTDGQTERQNQALEHYLRTYCNTHKDDWVQKLSFAEFAYNNSKHQVLNDTPFHTCYGYHPQLPWNPEDRIQGEVPAARERVQILLEEREKLQELWHRAQNNRETYYNRHRLDKHFSLHDWVMLSTRNIKLKTGKLGPKFIGPFKIIECIGPAAYKLDLPTLYSRLHPTFHVSLLEEYIAGPGKDPEMFPSGELPELSEDDEEQEWEVEGILDHKQDRGTRKYLIKWKSWPDDHNTWLPAYPNLENSQELLTEYNRTHGLEETRPKKTRRRHGPGRPPVRRKTGRP